MYFKENTLKDNDKKKVASDISGARPLLGYIYYAIARIPCF